MYVQTVDYQAKDAAKVLASSIRETGFAVIKNHPIAPELLTTVYKEWESFFASPDKLAYTYDPEKQAGYFPFKSENAKNYSHKDLKEFYHYYPWSSLPAPISTSTIDLFNQLNRVGSVLLQCLEQETPEEICAEWSEPLGKMIFNSPDTLLRVIHYPPLSDKEDEGAVRAYAHEDIDLLTVLPAATTPGLQVKDAKGNWHTVDCDPGTLVINAGDMLQMATQGYYKSTTHQVINPTGPDAYVSRYSMPLFLHPRPEVVLSPRHTAGSYLEERLIELGVLKEGHSLKRVS